MTTEVWQEARCHEVGTRGRGGEGHWGAHLEACDGDLGDVADGVVGVEGGGEGHSGGAWGKVAAWRARKRAYGLREPNKSDIDSK